MANSRLTRWSGPAAMIGGALLLLVAYFGSRPTGNQALAGIAVVVPILLLMGVIGLYFQGSPSLLGRIGFAVAFIASILMMTGSILMMRSVNGIAFLTWVLGVLMFPMGLLLLGIKTVQMKPLPRWNFLPLLMGLLGGPLAVVLELFGTTQSPRPYTDVGWTLWALSFGLGWVLLGYIMWTARSKRETNSVLL